MPAVRLPMLPPEPEDEVFRRLVPLVTGWCERLGGGRIDVQAAASDALVTLVRRADRLQTGASPEAWAYGITRRVVQAHRRRAWWRRWLPGAALDAVPAPRHADAEARECTRLVHQVLDQLSEPHREVIVLLDLEERTAPEVAALLGLPEGTVRSRLRLARAAFRDVAVKDGLGLLHVIEEVDDA